MDYRIFWLGAAETMLAHKLKLKYFAMRQRHIAQKVWTLERPTLFSEATVNGYYSKWSQHRSSRRRSADGSTRFLRKKWQYPRGTTV